VRHTWIFPVFTQSSVGTIRSVIRSDSAFFSLCVVRCMNPLMFIVSKLKHWHIHGGGDRAFHEGYNEESITSLVPFHSLLWPHLPTSDQEGKEMHEGKEADGKWQWNLGKKFYEIFCIPTVLGDSFWSIHVIFYELL